MRKLPPLASLRAFEAAARHLSFKAAAAELCVTPTAVSHQIRALEAACGTSLFRRRPRPLALTKQGARLYPVLRDGLDAFAAAMAALDSDTGRRPLRVTTSDPFAARRLVPRLPRWRESHPDIPLEIIGTNAVLDLRAGEADVAIRYAPRMPADLVGIELFRDTFFPVCRSELLADGSPIRRTAELPAYPWIDFDWRIDDPELPTLNRWLAAARAADPDVPALEDLRALRFREETHALEALLAGQGIAVCSSVHVGRELSEGRLVQAHALSLPGLGFYCVHLPDHPRLPDIETFAAWVRAVA